MKWYCHAVLFGAVILALSSCKTLNPNAMARYDKDYAFTVLTDTMPQDYPLAPGDRFDLYIFSNNGYLLVDRSISGNNPAQQNLQQNTLFYDISQDGSCTLPMIGEQQLAGLTEKEAEALLSDLYKEYFLEPYVQLRVINRRVTVFRGNDLAKVVEMPSLNMTVMEAIAAAGGIPPTGKAYRITLIRNAGRTDQSVSLIDLRDPEGLEQAGKLVRPNDVIYIEPTINTAFFKEIAPIISAVTSIFILYTYFDTISQ
ncbi:MAG: polysaccharide biosynthesis/export family protein [Chitinophagales bacterium]|nr:polysaccharide biosynthesis/export family protein [Chitinophagales bacterium]MCB9021310.1 polysaccharide biosynthesis/export family protein [Chitinophagales bacterium]HPE97825.1 polysaccharide biosynthesis/export family protein [Chitinophagales bacterium]HPR27725.1 polysaccharide biosynthesis/export family protein [Chitinophagales bacterium]HQU39040.1 polysaccharide biosynthesis/export family protein [Chitinophagales bacterium]